jgi:hypothetical protein
MSNTLLIYDGPSKLDGERILVFVSGLANGSSNAKTGAMVQTYILRADVDPIAANRTGLDYSICGDCPLRGVPNANESGTATKRGCYVRLQHGPLGIWRAWQRGNIPDFTSEAKRHIVQHLVAGRMIRLGSYGDPSAVPSHVWDALLTYAKGHTGYSHQVGHKTADYRPDLCMQSVETLEQAREAWSLGHRTCRLVAEITMLDSKREVLCPASAEAGKRTTCENCGLCNGAGAAKSVAIVAHGATKGNALRVIN